MERVMLIIKTVEVVEEVESVGWKNFRMSKVELFYRVIYVSLLSDSYHFLNKDGYESYSK